MPYDGLVLAVVLADVQAFHYGLNTQSVFSHNDVRSEAFEEISNMSFYLLYALNASDPSGSTHIEDAPRSSQSSLNLTATSSQSCALWSNLCGLISVWKILADPKVRMGRVLLLNLGTLCMRAVDQDKFVTALAA